MDLKEAIAKNKGAIERELEQKAVVNTVLPLKCGRCGFSYSIFTIEYYKSCPSCGNKFEEGKLK